MNELLSLRAQLLSLTAYRNILHLPVVISLTNALTALQNQQGEDALGALSDAFYTLHQKSYSSLTAYIDNHLHYDSAPYPEQAAAGVNDIPLADAAARDVAILARLCAVEAQTWRNALIQILPEYWSDTVRALPLWDTSTVLSSFSELTGFYRTNGAGLFSKYRAFLWQGGSLHPVENPDFTKPEDLVGYELQRNQLYANTAALLAGKAVNNALLYGESGTGKSATVKSLLGVPEFESLRLIEMDKSELAAIPDLIRMLAHRPQKFVLYIDDLAFDKDDQTYSLLKTILEGGLEPKPANVAIYATSNRRHLVRETFSDRAGDEIDANETIQEKTSLSERFGLRIPYSSLNQDQYLALCYELAAQADITLSREELRPLAIRFNLRHPGRTPRVAKQFIHSLHATS